MTKPPVFVLSTGRSGSKMLAHALAVHPEICAFHEPRPHMNVEAFVSWRHSQRHSKIVDRVDRKRAALVDAIRGNGYCYVESSHYCSHLIDQLSERFGAKFIFLHRHPYDFVKSALRHNQWYTEYGAGGKLALSVVAKRFFRRRFFIETGIGDTWEDMCLLPPRVLKSRAEKIAWLWSEVNETILYKLAQKPAQSWLIQPLESVDRSTVPDILRFIGVDASQNYVDRMLEIVHSRPNKNGAEYSVDSASAMLDAHRSSIDGIIRPTMGRLGYE